MPLLRCRRRQKAVQASAAMQGGGDQAWRVQDATFSTVYCKLKMQEEKRKYHLFATFTTGAKKRVFISPPVRAPHSLNLVGYMTNGGKPGLPLAVQIDGIRTSGHAQIMAASESTCYSASTMIVVNEPDKGKWTNWDKHKIGQFDSHHELHAMDITIIDTSTGAPAVYTPTAPATDIVVLMFELSTNEERDKRAPFKSYVRPEMHSAFS